MAYGLADAVQQRRMIEEGEADEQFKRLGHAKLDALLALCESATCRRQRLLKYFDEDSPACGNCDICLNPPQTWDGTEAARKALSCVYRTDQRFGAVHVVDVLLGRDTERIRQWHHNTLSTYGIGKELSEKDWRAVFRQLVALGYLEIDHGSYGALKLSPASRAVLKGGQQVMLRKQIEKKTAREARGKSPAAQLDAAGQGLFEQLRAWPKSPISVRNRTSNCARFPASARASWKATARRSSRYAKATPMRTACLRRHRSQSRPRRLSARRRPPTKDLATAPA
jgi:ATP-dependent DNA helicase RecQ